MKLGGFYVRPVYFRTAQALTKENITFNPQFTKNNSNYFILLLHSLSSSIKSRDVRLFLFRDEEFISILVFKSRVFPVWYDFDFD